MAQQLFDIELTNEELDQLDRDLRFVPCENRHPQVLTLDQIDQFNRNGYVTGLHLFDEAEIAAIRSTFDGWLEAALARGEDSYSIFTAHRRYPEAYDLIRAPQIVACVSDLLGENVVGWGCHFFCKLPHDGKQVAWHQDVSYWPLSASRNVTVWLAIDDADTENASMQFIPGSHLHGRIAYDESASSEQNVLNQTIADAESYGGPPVDVELAAGMASIHSDLLLHGSAANDSDRRRCGVTLRYCPAEVRALTRPWAEKGVVVRGTDPSGHWGNLPRPE